MRLNSVKLASARKSWEEQNRYKEFDARFTRDGPLLVAVDNSQQSDVTPVATSDCGSGKSVTYSNWAIRWVPPAHQWALVLGPTIQTRKQSNPLTLYP